MPYHFVPHQLLHRFEITSYKPNQLIEWPNSAHTIRINRIATQYFVTEAMIRHHHVQSQPLKTTDPTATLTTLATSVGSVSTKKVAVVHFVDDRQRHSYSDGEQGRDGGGGGYDVTGGKRRKRAHKANFFRWVWERTDCVISDLFGRRRWQQDCNNK